MTKEEIEEGNKLIAEFMGWKYIAADETKHFKYDYYIKPDGNHFDAWRLEYHSSWDWLMPVVEKIENLPTNIQNGERFNFNITGDGVGISKFDDGSGVIANTVNIWGKSKLDSTYKTIVQFIKWYNNNTPDATVRVNQTTHK